jgi:REP element-mobilizing transposase RayT
MVVGVAQLEMRAIVEAPLRPATRTWGGRRAGAGRPRKAAKDRTFVAHRGRPVHKKRHPTHVTLRAKKGLPSFRHQHVHKMLRDVIDEQTERQYCGRFQVVHYSIQSNHLHLIIEATDNRSMRSGVSGLVIAFAKRLNELLGRPTGKVWGDRYHSRDLTTPAEVRNALVYVMQNWKKHGMATFGPLVDQFSSALRFRGWSVPVLSPLATDPWPGRSPRTWLLEKGWTHHGLLWPRERPA